jgi:hypothetical protein
MNIYFLLTKLYGSSNQGFWPKIDCSQMKLLNFVSSSCDGSAKIEVINKSFLQKCTPKQLFSMKKKIRESKLALFDQLSPLDGDTKFGNFI